MLVRHWLTSRDNTWSIGIRLAVLNSLLAIFCIATFFGTLGSAVLLSTWLKSATGNPGASVHFPFLLLLLLYTTVLITAWLIFARKSRIGTRRQAFQSALVGATPFFGLSLLGYISVVWTLAFGDFDANSMLVASVWIYGIISTLILLAGLACVLLTTLLTTLSQTQSPSEDGQTIFRRPGVSSR